MRTADGTRPERTAKIDGYRYKLIAVGYRELYKPAEEINKAAGYRSVEVVSPTLTYHYTWHETDKGAPARLKPASKDQIARWPELAAYRDANAWEIVYLLWQKL
jgi:hypothetical protein